MAEELITNSDSDSDEDHGILFSFKSKPIPHPYTGIVPVFDFDGTIISANFFDLTRGGNDYEWTTIIDRYLDSNSELLKNIITHTNRILNTFNVTHIIFCSRNTRTIIEYFVKAMFDRGHIINVDWDNSLFRHNFIELQTNSKAILLKKISYAKNSAIVLFDDDIENIKEVEYMANLYTVWCRVSMMYVDFEKICCVDIDMN